MLARTAGWPVPGPVLGMALLFLALLLRRQAAASFQHDALRLLAWLPLFFIPAGVGVMEHGARLREEGAAILLALVLSTLLGLAVTAWVMARLLRRSEA